MRVNYLIEINSLDAWELTHPLSATAYKVLRKLLYLANMERFPERISVPNQVLISLVGCSEDSLTKARNQLIQYGLISYKGQKKVTPIYTIAYFSNNPVYNPQIADYKEENPEKTDYKQGIKQGYEQGIKQGYEQGIKQGYEQDFEPCIYTNTPKEIYRAEEDTGTSAAGEGRSAAAYLRSRGIALDGRCCGELMDFAQTGITDEMVCLAADEAVYYGKLSFAYISRIVNDWICEGIATLEAAKARQKRFRAEQEARKGGTKPGEGGRPKFFRERWEAEG